MSLPRRKAHTTERLMIVVASRVMNHLGRLRKLSLSRK